MGKEDREGSQAMRGRARCLDDSRGDGGRCWGRPAMSYPTRPYKWGEQVIKEDVRAQCTCQEMRDELALDALVEATVCPVCKEPASEPCECFETEEREQ